MDNNALVVKKEANIYHADFTVFTTSQTKKHTYKEIALQFWKVTSWNDVKN